MKVKTREGLSKKEMEDYLAWHMHYFPNFDRMKVKDLKPGEEYCFLRLEAGFVVIEIWGKHFDEEPGTYFLEERIMRNIKAPGHKDYQVLTSGQFVTHHRLGDPVDSLGMPIVRIVKE